MTTRTEFPPLKSQEEIDREGLPNGAGFVYATAAGIGFLTSLTLIVMVAS